MIDNTPRLQLTHSFNHNGHRTAKMTIAKKDDMFNIWVSLGDRGTNIRLDKENVEKLIAFLQEYKNFKIDA